MEFSVSSLEEMCDLMCGNVEREEDMVSQKFTENIVTILKNDGVKIGEFEREHGFSTGYLSRITKSNVKNISLDAAWELAESLELTIEEIITTDWVKEFEEEARVRLIEELEQEQERIKLQLEQLKG